MDLILSKVLSAIFDVNILVKIVDNIIDIYITGIGGCILQLEEKDVKVLQFDVSEQILDKIKQTVMTYLE